MDTKSSNKMQGRRTQRILVFAWIFLATSIVFACLFSYRAYWHFSNPTTRTVPNAALASAILPLIAVAVE
jgi:hypothetical protein